MFELRVQLMVKQSKFMTKTLNQLSEDKVERKIQNYHTMNKRNLHPSTTKERWQEEKDKINLLDNPNSR